MQQKIDMSKRSDSLFGNVCFLESLSDEKLFRPIGRTEHCKTRLLQHVINNIVLALPVHNFKHLLFFFFFFFLLSP